MKWNESDYEFSSELKDIESAGVLLLAMKNNAISNYECWVKHFKKELFFYQLKIVSDFESGAFQLPSPLLTRFTNLSFPLELSQNYIDS